MEKGLHGNPAARMFVVWNLRWLDLGDVAMRNLVEPCLVSFLAVLVPLGREGATAADSFEGDSEAADPREQIYKGEGQVGCVGFGSSYLLKR